VNDGNNTVLDIVGIFFQEGFEIESVVDCSIEYTPENQKNEGEEYLA
jgi:hypothetical protein